MLYIGVMPYYGNGPLWLARDFPIKNAQCSQYWWTFLTFTNNFLPDGKGSEVNKIYKLLIKIDKTFDI